jgi:hypothetical protein
MESYAAQGITVLEAFNLLVDLHLHTEFFEQLSLQTLLQTLMG